MKQHKTWVCTVCSQTFTRNSSAKRHNINLHEGKGVYVRFIDYEIGRVQGKSIFRIILFFIEKNLQTIMIFPLNNPEIIDY